MTPTEAAKILAEFNRWRRGEPPYDWNDDPKKRKELPFTPMQIGEAIDTAENVMKGENEMNNETLDDILASMRDGSIYGEDIGVCLHDLADRIEAAVMRERDEDRRLSAIAESDEAFARCARCDRPS